MKWKEELSVRGALNISVCSHFSIVAGCLGTARGARAGASIHYPSPPSLLRWLVCLLVVVEGLEIENMKYKTNIQTSQQSNVQSFEHRVHCKTQCHDDATFACYYRAGLKYSFKRVLVSFDVVYHDVNRQAQQTFLF